MPPKVLTVLTDTHGFNMFFLFRFVNTMLLTIFCTDFPDWSITATGSESLVKIGFEYGRSITREELKIDLDNYEENDQTTPYLHDDRTMVTMSAEVCVQIDWIVQKVIVYACLGI